MNIILHNKLALAVDIGGTKTSFGLVSRTGELLFERKNDTQAELGGPAVLERVIRLTKTFMDQSLENHPGTEIIGIGIGTAGDVDSESGQIAFATDSIPNWKGTNIKKKFQESFDLPTIVENDGNSMVMGEFFAGAGIGTKNLIGITIGTGIGGGLILDGRLFRGSKGFAGGLGHIIINVDNPRKCYCGKYGCLEAYAPAPRIIEYFIAGCEDKERKKIKSTNQVTVKFISRLARENHEAAITALKQSGKYVGASIATLLNIINPDMILIGGGVSQAGDIYLTAIENSAKAHMLPVNADIPIAPAKLGPKANLIGAGALIFNKIDYIY
jgi:glucokinase